MPHNGLPRAFGITARVTSVTGLVIFGRLRRDNPLVETGLQGEGA